MQMRVPSISTPQKSLIDLAPYVNVMEDGMMTAIGNGGIANSECQRNENLAQSYQAEDAIVAAANGNGAVSHVGCIKHDSTQHEKAEDTVSDTEKCEETPTATRRTCSTDRNDLIVTVKRRTYQLSRHSRKSMWLPAYIAIITTWPVVGSATVF